MLHWYFSISAEGHESGCWSQAGQLSNHRSTHFNHGIMGQFINLPNHSCLIKQSRTQWFTTLLW